MLNVDYKDFNEKTKVILDSANIKEILIELQAISDLLQKLETVEPSYRAIKSSIEQTKDKLIMYFDSASKYEE
jgi:hypothetical protein